MPRRFFLLIALLVLIPLTAAAQPPDLTPPQLYEQAMRELELGDVPAALAAAGQACQLAAARGEPLIHHAASVLARQLRGHALRRQRAWLDRRVLDTVVLVPDERSLIAALGGWTPELFYPVLIEDGWYSSLFIDAFKPRRIVRWSAPGAEAVAALQQAVVKNDRSLAEAMKRVSPPWAPPLPPGVVVIDPQSPQRGGGLALALGRGQPALLLSAPADHTKTLDAADAQRFAAATMQALHRGGVLAEGQWAALTLAGDYPYLYNPPPNDPAAPPPASNPLKLTGPLALDDLLGRQNGVRLAAVGRLIGDAAQSDYQAMCSLFLQPRRALLVDDYARRIGPVWESYRLAPAAELLGKRLPRVLLSNARLSLPAFRALTHPRSSFDLLLINSSGSPVEWAIDADHGSPDDLPLGRAAAMHVVHSFSAADPWDPQTIAGRALVGGAFWYFGSVHEPYLHAFARPVGFAAKIAAGSPLSFAARLAPGHPMAVPWKLMTVGDPLFALRPAEAARVDGALPLKGAQEMTRREPRLADAAKLSPGALARAAWLASVEANDDKPLADLPRSLAASHPVTLALASQALVRRCNRQLAMQDTRGAGRTLTRLLQLGVRGDQLSEPLGVWLHEMTAAKQRRQATEFLRTLEQQDLPEASRAAIRKLLGE